MMSTGGLNGVGRFALRTLCPGKRLRKLWRGSTPLLVVLLMVLAFSARAVSLEWDISPSPDVAGYIVYYGRESGHYTDAVDVGNTKGATIDIYEKSVLRHSSVFFAVTAYDIWGLESDYSNEVEWTRKIEREAEVDSAVELILNEINP